MYLTDVEAEADGHECVRLAVAHCELNPIELAWANVKEYVRKHKLLVRDLQADTEFMNNVAPLP